jgi:hypothetical protein
MFSFTRDDDDMRHSLGRHRRGNDYVREVDRRPGANIIMNMLPITRSWKSSSSITRVKVLNRFLVTAFNDLYDHTYKQRPLSDHSRSCLPRILHPPPPPPFIPRRRSLPNAPVNHGNLPNTSSPLNPLETNRSRKRSIIIPSPLQRHGVEL